MSDSSPDTAYDHGKSTNPALRWTLSSEDRASIRVISFDLDDTLWDCDPVIVQAEQTLYCAMEQQTPRITQALTIEDVREHRAQFGRTHPEYSVDVTYMRTASLRALVAEYGYPLSIADELFQVFYHARSNVVLYADAMPMLRALSANFHLAALTNGNADLALIGIASIFADIQHASLKNPPKPDRAMFDKTAARLAVSCEQILHVGDNPVTDVGGAHNAGAHAVWFNQHGQSWPDHLPPPQGEIATLIDLVTLLNAGDSSI